MTKYIAQQLFFKNVNDSIISVRTYKVRKNLLLNSFYYYQSFRCKTQIIINQLFKNKNKLKTKWKRNLLKELDQKVKNGQLRFITTLEKLQNF